MSWIKTIPYEASEGKLRKLLNRVKGPEDYVDNILLVHGLRPHTLHGHMVLYKNVLHHQDNSIPKWFLESIGVLVSMTNQCAYCVEHHFAGLTRLLDDDARSASIRSALENHAFDSAFTAQEVTALNYAHKLATQPANMQPSDLDAMRAAGYNDGEILEINQVTSYFSYANRTVLGLGVSLDNDILGLSPNDSSDAENWQHS